MHNKKSSPTHLECHAHYSLRAAILEPLKCTLPERWTPCLSATPECKNTGDDIQNADTILGIPTFIINPIQLLTRKLHRSKTPRVTNS